MTGLMVVAQDEGPQKLGKFPDWLTKGLDKPSFFGGKLKAGIQLGKILYKSKAYKPVIRYYAYRNRYRIGVSVAGSAFLSSFLQSPGQNGQTRNRMVQSSTRRRNRRKCYPPKSRSIRR